MLQQMSFKTIRIEERIEKRDLIEKLKTITDEDYNGNNGEQYYTHDPNMSNLEYVVKEHFGKMSIRGTIEAVIEDNYIDNPYYSDCQYEIYEDTLSGYYYVAVATLS